MLRKNSKPPKSCTSVCSAWVVSIALVTALCLFSLDITAFLPLSFTTFISLAAHFGLHCRINYTLNLFVWQPIYFGELIFPVGLWWSLMMQLWHNLKALYSFLFLLCFIVSFLYTGQASCHVLRPLLGCFLSMSSNRLVLWQVNC